MYPFYWTSSERGIFMRYTYEFKKKAVELYRQGKWIDAPNDIINLKNFHDRDPAECFHPPEHLQFLVSS